MIRAFADKRTELVFGGESPKGFPSSILKAARRKLKMVDAAVVLTDLRVPPGNHWKRWRVIAEDNIRSGSTISGGFVSSGLRKDRPTSKSLTIIERIGRKRD